MHCEIAVHGNALPIVIPHGLCPVRKIGCRIGPIPPAPWHCGVMDDLACTVPELGRPPRTPVQSHYLRGHALIFG
jgi:hypothetical protein